MYYFRKKMFHSLHIWIFVFLWIPQTSKSVTSSWAMLHDESYTYAYFPWILSTIKMKFGQMLVCCMTNISTWLHAGDWKFVPGSFMILLKQQYRKIWLFNSWHLPFLNVPYSPFYKKWNTGILKLLVNE